MNYPSLRLALVAGLVLPLGLATASFAQGAPPASPPGAPPAAGWRHHRDPAQMRAHMAEHLKAVLQLQPSQDGALNAFIEAMKSPGDRHDRAEHGRPGAIAHLTTPERLDKMMVRFDERREHGMGIRGLGGGGQAAQAGQTDGQPCGGPPGPMGFGPPSW